MRQVGCGCDVKLRRSSVCVGTKIVLVGLRTVHGRGVATLLVSITRGCYSGFRCRSRSVVG